MIRVGRISYINVLPIFEGLDHLEHDLSFVDWTSACPSELSRLFSEDALDVSFLSLGSYFNLQEHIIPLSSIGIAAYPCAHSVCLYSKVPLWDLHHRPLYVTSESQTSIFLLQVLCKHFWNIHPHFFVLDKNTPTSDMDAYLLIGDTCLNHSPPEEYTCIDLANAWYLATALPFTFSLFACRKNLPPSKMHEVRQLMKALKESYLWFTSHKDFVIEKASTQSPHSKEFFKSYFSDLKYLLDDKALEAVQVLKKLGDPIKKKVSCNV